MRLTNSIKQTDDGGQYMKEYKYYGHQVEGIYADSKEYPSIHTPQDLYDALSSIWCEYSCAPRYRSEWTKENMTLGQCSITSFLVQDIFGGEVRGVALEDGGYHCFNVVNGKKFDITSEQFGEKILNYDDCPIQTRAEHFASKEKYQRYLYLCNELKKAAKPA